MRRLPMLPEGSPVRGGFLPALLLGLVVVLATPPVLAAPDAAEGSPTALIPPGQWPDDVVELAASLPVQDEGRVKPLSTYARFTLLKMRGYAGVKLEAHDLYLDPTTWLLDVLFRPHLAVDYPVLLVTDKEVLNGTGIPAEDVKKRERWSFRELEPAYRTLAAKTSRIRAELKAGTRKNRDLSRLERQTMGLADNLETLGILLNTFGWAHVTAPVPEAWRKHFEGRAEVDALSLFEGAEHFDAIMQDIRGRYPADARMDDLSEEDRTVFLAFTEVARITRASGGLALIPPEGTAAETPAWLSIPEAFKKPDGPIRGTLRKLQAVAQASAQPSGMHRALRAYSKDVRGRAEARGELDHLDLEVTYYNLDPFFKALLGFLIAFVFVAIGWLKPGLRWPRRVAWGGTLLGLLFIIIGITMRCIIRQRPPVSTLYETVLFITGMAVLASLITERINKKGLALAAAAVLGALGMFVAGRYEAVNKEDTMPQLVAVLDSNFWLWTHVTTVTIGYCAGLLAAALAHVYVLGKAFGWEPASKDTYPTISRMVYGMVCFGLLFSTIGTILGGIWANDSWGRFWGWDPKENGALLIVLGNLAILHARLGGHIQAFGIAMSAIAVGVIVGFSWWGVNLLGIGLHSYGFTQSIQRALYIFYAVEGAVLLTGIYWYLVARKSLSTSS